MRAERDTSLRHFAQIAEAEHLKAAGIGEDGAVPCHEPLYPSQLPYRLDARPEVEVVGVIEENLHAQLFELVLGDTLHRSERADRHEHRRLYLAMRCEEPARTGKSVRSFDLKAE